MKPSLLGYVLWKTLLERSFIIITLDALAVFSFYFIVVAFNFEQGIKMDMAIVV